MKTRIINPLSALFFNRSGSAEVRGEVYIKIEYTEGKLSLSGVEAPTRDGNALGSCGQISSKLSEYKEPRFNQGWMERDFYRLKEYWRVWHLNNLQAGCEHQRAARWEDKRIKPEELPDCRSNRDEGGILAIWVYPLEARGEKFVNNDSCHKDGLLTKACPNCGYKYGSAWLKKEVPEEVINWLFALPVTKNNPAWV